MGNEHNTPIIQGAKLLLFFDMAKYFSKKMQLFEFCKPGIAKGEQLTFKLMSN